MINRQCSCGESQIERFGKNKLKPGGIDTYCLACRAARSKEYRLAHPEWLRASNQRPANKLAKKLWKKTADGKRAAKKYDQSMAAMARKSAYRRAHPELGRARRAMYVASKLQRTPRWLSKAQVEEITQFYKDAVYLTHYTKVKFEVDHIVPLRGKIVSGLHVPWNMQLLTKQENRAKQHAYGGVK